MNRSRSDLTARNDHVIPPIREKTKETRGKYYLFVTQKKGVGNQEDSPDVFRRGFWRKVLAAYDMKDEDGVKNTYLACRFDGDGAKVSRL